MFIIYLSYFIGEDYAKEKQEAFLLRWEDLSKRYPEITEEVTKILEGPFPRNVAKQESSKGGGKKFKDVLARKQRKISGEEDDAPNLSGITRSLDFYELEFDHAAFLKSAAQSPLQAKVKGQVGSAMVCYFTTQTINLF